MSDHLSYFAEREFRCPCVSWLAANDTCVLTIVGKKTSDDDVGTTMSVCHRKGTWLQHETCYTTSASTLEGNDSDLINVKRTSRQRETKWIRIGRRPLWWYGQWIHFDGSRCLHGSCGCTCYGVGACDNSRTRAWLCSSFGTWYSKRYPRRETILVTLVLELTLGCRSRWLTNKVPLRTRVINGIVRLFYGLPKLIDTLIVWPHNCCSTRWGYRHLHTSRGINNGRDYPG